MKSNSLTRPAPLLSVGNGRWHYNYNITERVDAESGQTVYDYEAVEFEGQPTYDKLVDARVRNLVATDEELSLINKYQDFNAGLSDDTADRDQYLAFRQQVHAIKAEVRQILNSI